MIKRLQSGVLVRMAATGLATIVGATCALPVHAAESLEQGLVEGFADPPASARPRVWWHWMNGNITQEGIDKDLAWMKRIGIAGLQNFDANISTPQIVDRRLVYMTPEWQEAFRFTAQKAAELDLELAIAASPGWSETGGPWVKPEDGMKKLVWSETLVQGGRRFTGRLPDPPSVSGPYQSMGKGAQFGGNDKDRPKPTAYGDIRVFAYSVASAALPLPVVSVPGAATAVDAAPLSDGNLETRLHVETGTENAPGTLEMAFTEPHALRSVYIFIPNQAQMYNDAALLPRLEVQVGEGWQRVADLPLTTVPTTVGFAPVTGKLFRVVFAPNLRADRQSLAPRRHPKFVQVAELRLSSDQRVDQFEAKSGLAVAKSYYDMGNSGAQSEPGLPSDRIVDLTTKLRADGSLDWKPPRGRWRVVRLGWSLTGTTNHPAPPEATGLEVDKYDSRAVRSYLETYLSMYRKATGDQLIGERGLRALLTDSTEVGASNWTPQMVEEFKRRRGYDPTPWLPALTGAMVETRGRTDAFLYDYRRTLADLHAEHYRVVAAVAHEQGLKVYSEALEGRRPSLGDDMAMRRSADYPMAAIWTYPRDQGPQVPALADMKGAASVAHIYGQNIAAAESLTSNGAFWAHAPMDLKRVIDLAFATGINRPVIHTSVHQPADDKIPGLSLAVFGQFFTRHETWAEMARPWIDYLARSSFLLQQGRNVADVAYFYGEERPLVELFGVQPAADAPKRYAYDFVNADALLNELKVEEGDLVSSGGVRYKILFLGGDSRRMTAPVLRALAKLAESGATLVGQAPENSPSLADDPAAFAALVKRLWSGEPITAVGKGRVIATSDVEIALSQIGVPPAFDYSKPDADSEILFVQRRIADGELFYVNNRVNRSQTFEARFRVSGKQPEIWRAEQGRSEPVSYRIENGETIVPLAMAAEDTFFVVFRKPATTASSIVASATLTDIASMDDGWTVSFQPGRGAPASAKLGRLAPLNEQGDPGIKYFSGVATYTNVFTLPRGVNRSAPLWLDLGAVGDLAEVFVNGQSVGTVWHAPFRLDIAGAAKSGRNRVEVRVANLWVNRLIGDAQLGATKIAWTASRTYPATAPLRASGLIGPVKLLAPAP